MKILTYTASALLLIGLTACNKNEERSDAYGNFEATEVLVSSEATGKLLQLTVEEGNEVEAGAAIGLVDTLALHLKKKQLIAAKQAIRSKLQNEKVQIDVLLEQKENLEREIKRVDKLFAEGAATAKQRDDLHGELKVLNNRIDATKSQLSTANRGLLAELAPLEVQMEQIEDQIQRSVLASPLGGTVLSKYAEAGEIVTFGKPLFKVADMKELALRAYVDAPQLASIKIGQKVRVLTDGSDGNLKENEGTVSWISSSAEFTPKIIQTREERVNLVYAIKVVVPNDGALKIGMPGEVKF
jgi:HlyD family secretion protein